MEHPRANHNYSQQKNTDWTAECKVKRSESKRGLVDRACEQTDFRLLFHCEMTRRRDKTQSEQVQNSMRRSERDRADNQTRERVESEFF